MDKRWPEEAKVICSICGASFLARTAAETGGYCKRHVFADVPEREWTEADDLFYALSPSGEVISSPKQLPALPFPKEIYVGSDSIHLDRWTIRTLPVSGFFMDWLEDRLFHWRHGNASPEDLEQIDSFVLALENQILTAPKKGENGFPTGRGNI